MITLSKQKQVKKMLQSFLIKSITMKLNLNIETQLMEVLQMIRLLLGLFTKI